MVPPHFPQHLECLISQLSSGRDYKSTETVHGCPLVTVQTLQHLEEFGIKTDKLINLCMLQMCEAEIKHHSRFLSFSIAYRNEESEGFP